MRCEITGDKCAILPLVEAMINDIKIATKARESIIKAKNNLDIRDYSELENLANSYQSFAENLQNQINNQACRGCPHRTA